MTERFSSTRRFAAPPERVFAALSDPNTHQYSEPTDWVRDAVDAAPIDHAGQVFAVNMYLDFAGGAYVMENKVTEFVPDRTIGWLPGQTPEGGEWEAGGWWWRYDLAPSGDGTDVTLTYDWSETPQAFRDQVPMPPFPPEYLDQSLEALDRHVSG